MRIPKALGVLLLASTTLLAQEQGKLTFDLASIRENKTGVGPGADSSESNVPLGPGNVYTPTGGQLNLRNIDLLLIVAFAYRMTGSQQEAFRDMAPQWAREARFDLNARTGKTDVTKDELRLMMQSLLADRFGMAAHYERRMSNVYALKFLKPNTPGPQLRLHTGNACSTDFKGNSEAPAADGYPQVCGGLLAMPGFTDEHFVIGARDIAINTIATSLTSWGDLGRPVVNDTGSDANYDFRMDFISPRVQASGKTDLQAPTFREALAKQLGLKLEPTKQPVPVLVLEHIDHPSEN
jgi:uncharacterized protein (TIGR03435 family)